MESALLRNILITGASRGLGAALANGLAAPGINLFLWARDQEALSIIQGECVAKGAEVTVVSADLSDIDALIQQFYDVDDQTPLDTIYLNAGLFDGARQEGEMEDLTSEMAIIDINMKATLAMANVAATRMRNRKRGHIVFISSLASSFALADAAAYSASKAGISHYAKALREKLMADGVVVSDVQPGHIQTSMAARHIGALPMIVSPEKAAAIIIKGVTHKKAIIAFPTILAWATFLLGMLPWRMRAFFGKGQRFYIK